MGWEGEGVRIISVSNPPDALLTALGYCFPALLASAVQRHPRPFSADGVAWRYGPVRDR